MEKLYKGLGDIMKDSVDREIARCRENAHPFLLSCHEKDGKWGVWLDFGQNTLLVNPVALVNSLSNEGHQAGFFLPFGEPASCHFMFTTRYGKYSIAAQLGHSMLSISGQQMYMIDEYVSKSQTALENLKKVIDQGLPLAYHRKYLSSESILTCCSQVGVDAVLPSFFTLRVQDIKVESLLFEPQKDEWCENFMISLGNRGYRICLTHWDSNMEKIRHELESYVFEKKTTVKLPFDTSETVLRLERINALDSVSNVAHYKTFQYKDFIQVTIEPNEFVNMPVIKGICDEKEVIRTLYEGLLKMARQHPEHSDEEDLPSRMIIYNQYKSPIIEMFLRGESFKYDEYLIRQVHVKQVLTICPDYDYFMMDDEGDPYDLDDLQDKNGKTIVFPELESWASEMREIVVASETGKAYEKDWADYHARGLSLCSRLREMLSTETDIWYNPPFEDKTGTVKGMILMI